MSKYLSGYRAAGRANQTPRETVPPPSEAVLEAHVPCSGMSRQVRDVEGDP